MSKVVIKELSTFEEYSDVILIDLSWVMHRSMHAFSNLSVDVGGVSVPTAHFYGVLDSVKKCLSAGRGAKKAVVLVRDGHPEERIKLIASIGGHYKDGRRSLEYDFYSDVVRIVKLASKHSDVYYSYHTDKESDDVLYCIAKQMKRRLVNPDMWIYSGDNDLLQAISPRIKVFRTFDKNSNGWVPITEENVRKDEVFTKKFHGVGPDKLPLFRSITGDPSDTVRGIDRFPRELLVMLVDRVEDIESLIEFSEALLRRDSIRESYRKYLSAIVQEQDRLRINYKVMKLEDKFKPSIVRVLVSDNEFEGLCQRYQINAWRKFVEESRKWQS